MRRNAENVNHRGHADVTGAATEKAAKESANEGNEYNDPKRNRLHARDRKRNHGPEFYFLNAFGEALEGGIILLLVFRRAALLCAKCCQSFPKHEGRNADVNDDRNHAHDVVDVARSFQVLDELRPDFCSADRPNGHDKTEAKIDVAHGAMTFRGDDRFSDDVGEIGPDREIPVQPDRAQRRTGNETAADAKKSAEDSD